MNGPSDATPGYLAQLVERVLPSVPPLQRRQPALFEPAQPRAGAGLHEAAAEVAAEAPAQRPRADAPGAPPMPMIRDRPLPSPEPPPYRRDALAAAPPPRAEMPNAPEVVVRHETTTWVREAPRVDASFRSAPPAVTPGTRAATSAPAVTPTALQERAPERRAPAPLAAAPAVGARTPVPHAAVPPAEPTRRAVPVRDEAPLSRRTREPASPPPPPQARPRASSPPAPSRAASRAAVQAALRQSGPPPPRDLAPVEVTIGRVEVRAVAAPPSAARGARPAPRLSLEQYLDDRNGDRR